MIRESKHPSAAFWATVVVIVVVLYVLSTGPVVLLHERFRRPYSWNEPIAVIYWPLLKTVERGPDWYRRTFDTYVTWWAHLAD